MSWRDLFPVFISKQWDSWFKKVEESLVYFTPTYVSKDKGLFSPIIALIALITSIILVGIAVGSFFSLFISLLVLYFILTKIFGISLNPGDVFVV